MNNAEQIAHELEVSRLEIDSRLSFDGVLRRLHEQTGKSAVLQIDEVARASHSSEEFEAEVTRRFVGPSGFMIFAELDHGAWIEKYGIERRALRIILGNPLFAIAMLRHDISAGLFAPVEMLLVENGPGSTLHYVRPSTLMLTGDNPPPKTAALELDRKLEQLVSDITALTNTENAQKISAVN